MRKRSKTHSEKVPPVKLYLDDIEKIVEIIAEVSDQVLLITDEYEFVDASDLASLERGSINALEITCSDPYLQFELAPGWIRLYIGSDTPESRGTLEKVKAILLTRRRRLGWLRDQYWLAPWFWLAPLALLLQGIESRAWLPIVAGIGGTCLFAVWLWWGYRAALYRHTVIVLRRRKEEVSFWKRNSDTIIVGIIMAVVAGLLGSVLTLFVQAVSTPPP